MSDFRSRRIKRIRHKATLTCVFSVGTAISFSTATFAWFTINRQATLQYMNIVAQDSAMVEEVNYYGIKEVAGQSYTFDTTKNKAYLEQYDRELGSRLYQVLIQENGRTRRFISSQGHGKQVTASNRFVG